MQELYSYLQLAAQELDCMLSPDTNNSDSTQLAKLWMLVTGVQWMSCKTGHPLTVPAVKKVNL